MRFKVHFNRINMQRGKDTIWTVHTSKQCIPAREVKIHVPIETIYRPTARQPRAYMVGDGTISNKRGVVTIV